MTRFARSSLAILFIFLMLLLRPQSPFISDLPHSFSAGPQPIANFVLFSFHYTSFSFLLVFFLV